MLEVRLLGKFEIQQDGKPVLISSRIGQSLFAFLILSANPYRHSGQDGKDQRDCEQGVKSSHASPFQFHQRTKKGFHGRYSE
jgi:hypothetical protein